MDVDERKKGGRGECVRKWEREGGSYVGVVKASHYGFEGVGHELASVGVYYKDVVRRHGGGLDFIKIVTEVGFEI